MKLVKQLLLMMLGVCTLGVTTAQMIASDQQYMNQDTHALLGDQDSPRDSVVDKPIQQPAADINPLPSQLTNTDTQKVDASSDNYLTIPLSQSWLVQNKIDYSISEGWTYGSKEQAIHGFANHKSIDYALPYGTPVYSPVDGYIQGSYYNTTLGAVGARRQYQGTSINYGLGYRVQIIYPDPQEPLNPQKATMIQLSHLSRFSTKVKKTIAGLPYIFDPIEDAMKIDNYSLTYDQVASILDGNGGDHIVAVKRGDLIGYVGSSGLEKGEEVDASYIPRTYVYDIGNSWDEAHIHMQIYRRSSEGYKIGGSIVDPYNLDGSQSDQYPTHNNGGVLTSGHVFKSMDGLLPDYAK